jgi:HEAT repeat protein
VTAAQPTADARDRSPRPDFVDVGSARGGARQLSRGLQVIIPFALLAAGVLGAIFLISAPRLLVPMSLGVLAICVGLLVGAALGRERGREPPPLDVEALRGRIRRAAASDDRRAARRVQEDMLARPHLIHQLGEAEREPVRALMERAGPGHAPSDLIDSRRSRATRIGGVHLLAWLGGRGAVGDLVTRMGDADPWVAHAAAEALARLDEESAYRALIQQIGRDALPASRLAALLERIPPARIAHMVAENVDDPDPQRRFWMAFLLGRMRNPDALELLLPLSRDPDANVRANAAEALGDHPDPRARQRLHELLADEAWFVQAHAAKGLAVLGPEEEETLLGTLLASPNWWVRDRAAKALARGGVPADRALSLALREGSPEARRHAAAVLVQRGDWERYLEALGDAGEPAPWAQEEVRALLAAGAGPALPRRLVQSVAAADGNGSRAPSGSEEER